ncbi:four-helix bundle copper-binding protein [Haloarcula sp. S1CR25-12]|uniref:Four-helix bundle copper-binding protein n=1 Tax=Haloarcula saliterrae TaxID=2950534 RepID=A0ABU2FGB9_9EURY|nr:four-helix bundle copper-binding protein [Haloarcula sp. S1CR25-12]MDS0261302.1 four-helix bundle copper-binding protein [Haloarcula sp. S1CR25-12]
MSQTQYSGSSTAQQGYQSQSQQQDAGQLPQQYRQSLSGVAQAIEVCGWCADKCIEEANPNMVECIKLCEDVVEIGETLLAVAPRSSRFTSDLVQTFERAAQACAQECGQHAHSHCQECAAVLPQASQMARQLSGQSRGMSQQQGGQQTQQFAGGQTAQQFSQ